MSSGRLKENKKNHMNYLYESGPYLQSLVSELIIPFSNHKNEFLYDGTEDIPFKERDPIYQRILIEEFVIIL